MPEMFEHVGQPLLSAERDKLLAEYAIAVTQAAHDPVKAQHGNVGEAAFRKFLATLLPKKYGVTKGYIITPDMNYAGPLEEWDIIIYDALESPVLSVRKTADDSEGAGMRGIPVEYVKGVIEVKANFTVAMAKKAADKLVKLHQFYREPAPPNKRRAGLPSGFAVATVFFEVKLTSPTQFSEALGALNGLWLKTHWMPYFGGLIIRADTHPNKSARIHHFIAGQERMTELLPDPCELSPSFPVYAFTKESIPENDLIGYRYFFSTGFSENEFWSFMLDFFHELNGHNDEFFSGHRTLSDGYGGITKNMDRKRLFQPK